MHKCDEDGKAWRTCSLHVGHIPHDATLGRSFFARPDLGVIVAFEGTAIFEPTH